MVMKTDRQKGKKKDIKNRRDQHRKQKCRQK